MEKLHRKSVHMNVDDSVFTGQLFGDSGMAVIGRESTNKQHKTLLLEFTKADTEFKQM